MGAFSIWHWLVVLAIVVLVFGTRKLRNLGSDLGGAVRGFKEGLKGADEEESASSVQQPQQIVDQPLKREAEVKVETDVKDQTRT